MYTNTKRTPAKQLSQQRSIIFTINFHFEFIEYRPIGTLNHAAVNCEACSLILQVN